MALAWWFGGSGGRAGGGVKGGWRTLSQSWQAAWRRQLVQVGSWAFLAEVGSVGVLPVPLTPTGIASSHQAPCIWPRPS